MDTFLVLILFNVYISVTDAVNLRGGVDGY